MKTGNIGNAQNLYSNYHKVIKPGKDGENPAANIFKNPVDTYEIGRAHV